MPVGTPPADRRGLLAAGILGASYLFLVLATGIVYVALHPDLLLPGVSKVSMEVNLGRDALAKVPALLGTVLLLGWMRRRPVDPRPAPAGPAVRAGLLAATAFLPVQTVVVLAQQAAYDRAGWTMQKQPLVEEAQRSPEVFALVAVFAVVLAPVFEETLFRSWLYAGVRARTGPLLAAVLTAAAFALFHFQVDVVPVLFALGLFLAWLRERTGGRSAPIAMHACYNAFQMAGILVARPGSGG